MTLRKRHVFQILALVAGGALFVWSLRQAGSDHLSDTWSGITGANAAFVLFYVLSCGWDVAGWKLLFPAEVRSKTGFWGLFMIRLVGEAMNGVTPFVDIGGEPVKLALVSSRYGLSRRFALASVVMARSALMFSEVAFWVLGLLIIARSQHLPPSLQLPVWITLIAMMAVCSALALGQRFGGIFGGLAKLFGVAGAKWGDAAKDVDRDIAEFYKPGDTRLALSFVLHFIGWVVGGGEMWLIFRILGAPITLAEGIALEAFIQLAKTASFFIPGSLGAQEAAMGLIAQGMGVHPGVGVAASLMKRFRQMAWTVVGFALWPLLLRQGKTTAQPKTV